MRERKPANKTSPIRSTVGAGDTFIAGILFGFLCHQQDWDVATKVKFAVELATCKVQQEGFGGVGSRVLGDHSAC